MTQNGSTSSMTYDRSTDGALVFRWDGDVRVELPNVPLDRRGRRQVAVYHHTTLLTSGRVQLDDLHDRQQLALHTAPTDPAAMGVWLARLVELHAALQETTTQEEVRTLEVRQLSAVNPERVEWLWHPLLPLGRPVSLEGNPGVGKSNVVLKIAAHLTTGTRFPTLYRDGQAQPAFPPQTVCLLASEDDAGDTIRPRLEVNGGDPARVQLLDGWRHPDGRRGMLTLQDLRLLEQALETYTPALLVIDPFQAFFGRGVDMNHANETRPVLADIAALCKEKRCTLLYVRHLGKSHREHAIYAAIGSIDISAHVRSAMLVGVDPDNPARRILAHHKAANALEAESLAFTLTAVEREMFRADESSVMVEASRVDWDGFSPYKAADLIAPRATDEEEEENKSAVAQAVEFLEELLQPGPVLYSEVKKALTQTEISTATLRRAKARLGVTVRRVQQEGKPQQTWPWEWRLLDVHEDDTP